MGLCSISIEMRNVDARLCGQISESGLISVSFGYSSLYHNYIKVAKQNRRTLLKMKLPPTTHSTPHQFLISNF